MRPLFPALLLLGAAWLPVAGAQEPSKAASSPEVFGTVTGQVLCADTQRPARLASVSFIPIPPAPPPGKVAPVLDLLQTAQTPVRTDVTGRFVQPKLKPGHYYLNATLDGYLAPAFQFTPEMMQHPSPETQERLRNELTEVIVQPNRSVDVQLTLVRGASLSGTVLYDDGTPAIGMPVELLRKDAHGAFTEFVRTGSFGGFTDARGRFNLDSLAASEYAVEAELQMTRDVEYDEQLANGRKLRASFVEISFFLPVYFGDVLRLQEAVPITLSLSESRSGLLISIPLSRLHEISGTLTAKDGHALNAGTVQLRYPDDDSVSLSVTVDRETGRFVFNYTPEGSYTLAIDDARDMAPPDAPETLGSLPSMARGKTLHKYGSTRQPLIVDGEKNDLLLIVPDASGDAKPPAAAGQP